MYKKNTAFNCSRYTCIYPKFYRTMKLIMVFVFAAILQVSAATYAQQISLQTNGETIESIFINIKRQSGYDFLYSANLLKKVKPLSIRIKNASITQVMDRLLVDQPLTYIINGKTITLKAKLNQDIDVKGKVVDKDGNGIQGVNIRVKDRLVGGVISNVDGDFSIKASGPKSILTFSFLGFITQEVVVGTKNNLTVVLQEQQNDLSEVVVTALGIKREEKSLGYAITKIEGDDIAQTAPTNWVNALSGKVPGLNISRAGAGPGGSVRITLRGQNSLDLDKGEPLLVIDGVPVTSGMISNNGQSYGAAGNSETPVDYGNALGDINPDDIKEVSILRGPSAAALY
ncbi:MAG: SusC/RagA family TonB-linked outer membrane protein, partial [Pedobacter sp.]